MRKESTMRDLAKKLRTSNYAEYYAIEIAVLEWALGDCVSIKKRRQEVIKQYGKPTITEKE